MSSSNCLAREIVLRLDMTQDHRTLALDEAQLRKQLKGLSLGLASLERTIARQRAQLLQLRDGDANTCFFHAQASFRRRKNHIAQLEQDGQTAFEHDDKAQMLHSYFEGVLGQELEREFTLNLEELGLTTRNFQ